MIDATHPPRLCPIHICAWQNNRDGLRSLMRTNRAMINYQDEYGNTPLHYAIFRGHHVFVRDCLDFDANLLLRNNGMQDAFGVIMESRLALIPDPAWSVDAAKLKAQAIAHELHARAPLAVVRANVSESDDQSEVDEVDKPADKPDETVTLL